MAITDEMNITKIWQLYEEGKKLNEMRCIQKNSEAAYAFYEGDQWKGLPVADPSSLPFQNFIKPTIDYKLNMVCLNDMRIHVSGENKEICNYLMNTINKKMTDVLKMDKEKWQTVKDGLISGSAYLFFPDGMFMKEGYRPKRRQTLLQHIDANCIFFGDEKEPNIQKQPYIIIMERRPVKDIKKEAEENGVPKEAIDLITEDEIGKYSVISTETKEENTEKDGKCTSLLYMEIRDDVLHVMRSTRYCIYQPDRAVIGQECGVGMTCYPLVSYIDNPKKGSARGRGEVLGMIPNQIEYNRNLVRMAENVKMAAYPKLAYNREAISNPDDLSKAGAAIAFENNSGSFKVSDVIGYLPASAMSSDALAINNIFCDQTRDLNNAGSAVTGNIDPTKASGTAIIAMRDQANVPLNEIQAEFQKLYEDTANVLYRYLVAYNPEGIHSEGAFDNDEGTVITQKELDEAETNISVDVSSTQPYSIYGEEKAIENLFLNKIISFEEYVEALPDNGSTPKAKLLEIIRKREEMQRVEKVQQAIETENDVNNESSVLEEMNMRQTSDQQSIEGGEEYGQV